jgi:PhoH-like ATPase
VYVLDASVLLSDHRAVYKFGDNTVVVPVAVLVKLAELRDHPVLGYGAKRALIEIDALRADHGLREPIALENGGTLRFVGESNPSLLSVDLRQTPGAGARVLSIVRSLDGSILVSKDPGLRVLAGAEGLAAEDYRFQMPDSDWSGFVDLELIEDQINQLYSTGVLEGLDPSLPLNAGVRLKCGGLNSGLGRITGEGRLRIIPEEGHKIGKVTARNKGQSLAVDLLLDPEISCVSLGGPAGTGKTLLALAAALAAQGRDPNIRIIVIRSPEPLGGGKDKLGFLPGTLEEKMRVWSGAVIDALEVLDPGNAMNRIKSGAMKGNFVIEPEMHLRGRTFNKCIVIVDEVQNLTYDVLVSILERLGVGSTMILTHNARDQRDNPFATGAVETVIATLRGERMFGHVTLSEVERSPWAALVAKRLHG